MSPLPDRAEAYLQHLQVGRRLAERSLVLYRAALERLQALVDSVATLPKSRRATKPTLASKQRRLEGKATRSTVKQLRGRVRSSD